VIDVNEPKPTKKLSRVMEIQAVLIREMGGEQGSDK
jgi:hypothetical protein